MLWSSIENKAHRNIPERHFDADRMENKGKYASVIIMDKNLKPLSKKPKGNGWELTDPARSLEQAKEMVMGGYGKDTEAVIVKTRKADGNASVFPYHVWTRRINQ